MQKNNFSLNKLFKPEYMMIWVLVGICVLFAILRPEFATLSNLLDVFRQGSLNALMILGVTLVIVTGEIDVSFPDTAGMSSMLMAYLFIRQFPFIGAFALSILAGAIFGALSGFLVTRMKFSAVIATIAVAGITKSIAYALGGVQTIPMHSTNNFVYVLVMGRIGPVPILLLFTVLLYTIIAIIQQRMVLGQHIYAIGENRTRAFQAGLKIKPIVFSLLVFSSAMASFTGVLTTAIFQSGIPKLGVSFFLDGFSAVFLGSMMFKLGKPNVLGSFVGAIMLAIIANGLTLIGAQEFVNYIIKGIVLIVSVIIVIIIKNKKISAAALKA